MSPSLRRFNPGSSLHTLVHQFQGDGRLLDGASWWPYTVLHPSQGTSVGCPRKYTEKSLRPRSYLTLLGLKAKNTGLPLSSLAHRDDVGTRSLDDTTQEATPDGLRHVTGWPGIGLQSQAFLLHKVTDRVEQNNSSEERKGSNDCTTRSPDPKGRAGAGAGGTPTHPCVPT